MQRSVTSVATGASGMTAAIRPLQRSTVLYDLTCQTQR